ncbi:MAG: hypothetical protein JW860_10470 [Sedimentisphaerales bacterium]|nr:hypothetical protein [Sedimentisphaerales bacterium]
MKRYRIIKKEFGYITVLMMAFYGLWQLPAPGKGMDEDVLIEDVPHVRQKSDFCGEACIAMYLQKSGYRVSQDQVFNLAGVDPSLGRGCVTRDMKEVLERIGFEPGAVWYLINPANSERELNAQWQEVLADLHQGIPSIVCMHLCLRIFPNARPGLTRDWHPFTNNARHVEMRWQV